MEHLEWLCCRMCLTNADIVLRLPTDLFGLTNLKAIANMSYVKAWGLENSDS